VRQARQHFNAGQYDQAIERLTLAYGLRPRPEYLFSIAQSYRRAGKNREALRAYQRFLRVAPDSNLRSEAGNYIGELTLLLRQQEAAERERRRPVWRRPWFWGVLGSATVAAGVALGVGLGVGLQQPPPETLTFSWRRPLAYPESR
jgi:tetratricopeptide (TPR) repeat protein